jgi:hypothetical protein
VVFIEVSASGKSSLAFGTLYAEAQRRDLESVSPYARRRLFHQMAVPEVDSVEGLPPAVAWQQQRGSPTTRSSVGSLTTSSNLLRMLYSLRRNLKSSIDVNARSAAGDPGGHASDGGVAYRGLATSPTRGSSRITRCAQSAVQSAHGAGQSPWLRLAPMKPLWSAAQCPDPRSRTIPRVMQQLPVPSKTALPWAPRPAAEVKWRCSSDRRSYFGFSGSFGSVGVTDAPAA